MSPSSFNHGDQSVIQSRVASVVEAFITDEPNVTPQKNVTEEGRVVKFFCLTGDSSPAADISWQVRVRSAIRRHRDSKIFHVSDLSKTDNNLSY